MVYLTHYTEYPIYYPEEGGYYTAGSYVEEYYRLNSEKQAKRKLAKLKKNWRHKVLKYMRMEHSCTEDILVNVKSGKSKRSLVRMNEAKHLIVNKRRKNYGA